MDMERIPEYIIIRLETYSDTVVSRENNVTPNIREMNREMDIYGKKFAGRNFFNRELWKSAEFSYRGVERGIYTLRVYVDFRDGGD